MYSGTKSYEKGEMQWQRQWLNYDRTGRTGSDSRSGSQPDSCSHLRSPVALSAPCMMVSVGQDIPAIVDSPVLYPDVNVLNVPDWRSRV